ncbi:MAG: ER membrane complex subunit 3 [Watsoniomyces obsoletus]|nr:MAG: ER membrane complex subunit 3 [Watsoniomyces obsoletus]
MSSEELKISVYSVADLKNTTDDALPNYLNSLKFRQSHYYIDVRLALGFSAVAIAAATFYFDYTLGWEKTKTGTLWAVIAYFIINGLLTLWIWRVERGCVYSGELKGAKLHVESRVEKYNPTYFLSIRYSKPGRVENWQSMELNAPFAKWFDAEGHFVAVHFQQWLATEIPVVGAADPKRVIPQASSDEKTRKGGPSVLKTALESPPAADGAQRRREKQSGGGKSKNR